MGSTNVGIELALEVSTIAFSFPQLFNSRPCPISQVAGPELGYCQLTDITEGIHRYMNHVSERSMMRREIQIVQ